MCKYPTRRAFLSTTGAIASGMLFAPSNCLAEKQGWSIHYTFDGFTSPQERLVRDSLDYAVTRMLDFSSINKFMTENRGQWHLDLNSWCRSNLPEQRPADRLDSLVPGKSKLLPFQLIALREFNALPNMKVTAFHERSDVWGRAPVGTLDVTFDPKSRVKGNFEIELNTYNMNRSNPKTASTRTWGAVIAHEFLHNPGHKRAVDNYRDDEAINLFENFVAYDGRYQRGNPRHFQWRCEGCY
ncbi:MAG: hypothetical protein H8E66_05700 [Planctomycetes bacterium]|nr:hypothetical protein [Planctomycetota bacterium]